MRHTIQMTYVVNTPDQGTPAWENLVEHLREDDPTYFDDPENLEPQVLEGNLAFYLVEQVHAGDFTDRVELVDYTIKDG